VLFLDLYENKMSESYRCSKCGRAFETKEELEKHERNVHGVDYLAQGIIRVIVDGPPGLGKKILLEKIAAFLAKEKLMVSEPKEDEKLGSWVIEIRNPE